MVKKNFNKNSSELDQAILMEKVKGTPDIDICDKCIVEKLNR